MSVKAILVLCAQALLVKSAVGQCAAPVLAAPCGLAGPGLAYSGAGWPYNGLAAGYGGLGYDGLYGSGMDFTPTSGGALPVSSSSALAPVGISVASENVYEGALAAAGELPFVGTVGVEGLLATAGAGAVNHACGNGRNAMISEGAAFSPAAAGYASLGGIAPALGAPLGYSAGLGYPAGLNSLTYPAGWAGRTCGCGISLFLIFFATSTAGCFRISSWIGGIFSPSVP